MHNNTSKSAEIAFDMSTVEARWRVVHNVAKPAIQEKLIPIFQAVQPEQFRPTVNVEVANAVINSTVQQLTAREQELAAASQAAKRIAQ